MTRRGGLCGADWCWSSCGWRPHWRMRCGRPTCSCARSTRTPTTCCGRFRPWARSSGSRWMSRSRRKRRRSGSRAPPSSTTPSCSNGACAGPAVSTARRSGSTDCSPRFTDVLVRLERMDGTTQTLRVTPAAPSFVIEAQPGRWQVAKTYLLLGIEHILLGVDHLLFVLALVILVDGTRRLFWTITAFTAAHSITLAAATLGWVHVPSPPVEASIALSIVFLASEIMHRRAGRPGLTYRQPWIVAFLFGLLHGLGFAGALSEVGLPANAIPFALLFFNVGVEIGQLLFIAAVLAAMAALRRVKQPVMGRAGAGVCHRHRGGVLDDRAGIRIPGLTESRPGGRCDPTIATSSAIARTRYEHDHKNCTHPRIMRSCGALFPSSECRRRRPLGLDGDALRVGGGCQRRPGNPVPPGLRQRRCVLWRHRRQTRRSISDAHRRPGRSLRRIRRFHLPRS